MQATLIVLEQPVDAAAAHESVPLEREPQNNASPPASIAVGSERSGDGRAVPHHHQQGNGSWHSPAMPAANGHGPAAGDEETAAPGVAAWSYHLRIIVPAQSLHFGFACTLSDVAAPGRL